MEHCLLLRKKKQNRIHDLSLFFSLFFLYSKNSPHAPRCAKKTTGAKLPSVCQQTYAELSLSRQIDKETWEWARPSLPHKGCFCLTIETRSQRLHVGDDRRRLFFLLLIILLYSVHIRTLTYSAPSGSAGRSSFPERNERQWRPCCPGGPCKYPVQSGDGFQGKRGTGFLDPTHLKACT